jgi:hypothetical protein
LRPLWGIKKESFRASFRKRLYFIYGQIFLGFQGGKKTLKKRKKDFVRVKKVVIFAATFA